MPRLTLRWLIAAEILLTVVLGLTGGAMNPFSLLYLVLALAGAMVLDTRGTWAIVVLGGLAYGSLFLPPFNPHAHHLDAHLLGMWLAYVIVAPLTAIAVIRLRHQLAEALGESANARKLTALATLAAGTTHELATPLSTIHVAAHELRRNAGDNPAVAEDAALIVSEVERATEVLGQMSADAGSGIGEELQIITAGELVDQVLDRLRRRDRVTRDEKPDAREAKLKVPPRQTARALKGLLANACDAGTEVTLSLRRRNGSIHLDVEDDGPGLPADVLGRIGEPFYTTKPPGTGMGLGVFFARSVITLNGGSLGYEARPGGGTRACVVLPVEASGD
ncbi:MAG: HAMP domain-containing histidine kinase [Proteobacteria bacterium]|nr:HAMP domain-containing histidine kinase [Pseudomonadota bacterium]